MKSLIIIGVLVCGLVTVTDSAFTQTIQDADIFMTPETNPDFFSGYAGGDVSTGIDWSIGNNRPFDPAVTEDMVFSTNIRDYHNPDDWMERMRITKDGYVGIGTPSPNAELEVNGNIIAYAPTANNHVATKAYVDAQAGGGEPTMLSAESTVSYTHSDAVIYCRNLDAPCQYWIDGTCGGPVVLYHDDWRIPTVEELALFLGITYDGSYLWTRTVRDATTGFWICPRLSDGHWYSYGSYTDTASVRCVR